MRRQGLAALALAAGLAVPALASADEGPSAGFSADMSRLRPRDGDAWGRTQGFALRAGLGGSYTRLYSLNIWTVDTELAAGAHALGGSIFGALGYQRGATGAGLDVSNLVSSVQWEFPFERFRFGVGPRFGLVSIDRATGGEDSALTLGGLGYAILDLVEARPFVLFVQARLTVDVTAVEEQDSDPSAMLVGGGPTLGVRY